MAAFTTFDRNRRCDRTKFVYRRCASCGLVFLANPPDDLGPYYAGDYYGAPSLEVMEQVAEADRYQVEFVTDRVTGGRLTEIGTAWGVFALQAKHAGFDVTGVEMDPRCCAFLRETVGVDAVNSEHPDEALAELPPSRAIAMWHSIEHLRDPWTCLDHAARNLEPGGVLVIATPNPSALGFRLTRGRWPHVDAPRHLWIVPLGVLEQRVRAHGLRLDAVTASDPGALHWNEFAWQRWLANMLPKDSVRLRRVTDRVAGWITRAARRAEGRGMNGSAYTAVFRKEP